MNHTFYKEEGIWYIDLPEFLNAGLGTKANLMMVAGADTFLDRVSGNGHRVQVEINTDSLAPFDYQLQKVRDGLDKELLAEIGHAPVDYGAYYNVLQINHELWLCPVTEYVFGGGYPEEIYIKVLDVN